jgi:hypothetical protein
MKVEIGQDYKYFKGGVYEVIALGKDAQYLEDVVIYEDITDPKRVWVRSLADFTSDCYKDGVLVKRFKLVTEEQK